MFVAGLEIDIDEMLHSGRVSVLAGSVGVIVPLTLGALTLPLFPPLRSLFAHETPKRTMFAVVDDEVNIDQVIAASEKIVGSFDAPNSGILFVAPVTHVRGLRRPP